MNPNPMDPHDILHRAIDKAGNVQALARSLGYGDDGRQVLGRLSRNRNAKFDARIFLDVVTYLRLCSDEGTTAVFTGASEDEPPLSLGAASFAVTLPRYEYAMDREHVVAVPLGRAVYDRRNVPGRHLERLSEQRMPTDALGSVIQPDAEMLIEEGSKFVGAGIYAVELDGRPVYCRLSAEPGGGYCLSYDKPYPSAYVDPDGEGGYVERRTKRPCTFKILGAVCKSARLHRRPSEAEE
jgi:hypothetical protein